MFFLDGERNYEILDPCLLEIWLVLFFKFSSEKFNLWKRLVLLENEDACGFLHKSFYSMETPGTQINIFVENGDT